MYLVLFLKPDAIALLRGTHWLRRWSQLQHCDDKKERITCTYGTLETTKQWSSSPLMGSLMSLDFQTKFVRMAAATKGKK